MPPGFYEENDVRNNNRSGSFRLLIGILIGILLAEAFMLLLFGGFSGLRSSLKYAEILRVIRRDFVGEYDAEELGDAAAAGLVSALDDKWSYYMNAEAYEDYQDYSANRYQGIGVTVSQDEDTGGFLILAVTRDGPAQLAGITAGDVILAVDGVSVVGEDTYYLRELIQADFGKDARVTVRHSDGTEEEYAVSCREVFSNPVSYTLLDEDVGYIRIDNFREGAAKEAIAAIDALRADGAAALVFDVRNDPGGQLTELVSLLDYLLPEGDIFIQADKDGHEKVETSDAACVDLPMAVIVNGDTYSAAEFFAAALREYDAAVIVGEPTTGKARSQVTVALSDGSAVHISKYTYLTPKRSDLYEAGGIVPDAEIALTEEERLSFNTGWLEPQDDPQVLAAMDAVRQTR